MRGSEYSSPIDVIVLDEPDAVPTPRRKQVFCIPWLDNKPWPSWAGAALVTAIVHLTFFGSLTLGTGRLAARTPEREGLQSIHRDGDGNEIVTAMIFLNDRSIHIPDEANESVYAHAKTESESSESAALATSIDNGPNAELPTLAESDESSPTTETQGDGGEAAMLFGRYMGQIKARIERAWEYPISPARASTCQVQIRQSKQGEVEDIAVQRCTMTLDQQLSLVRAIQAASPLSAPPDERLFTEVITLTFAEPVQTAVVAAARAIAPHTSQPNLN